MLERNTSEQSLPIASCLSTPVISWAARLKEVILHSGSTVKTPSEMLSRMASVTNLWIRHFDRSWNHSLIQLQGAAKGSGERLPKHISPMHVAKPCQKMNLVLTNIRLA